MLIIQNLLVGKLYYPLTSSKTFVFSITIFSLLFLFVNPTILYLTVYKAVLCSFKETAFALATVSF